MTPTIRAVEPVGGGELPLRFVGGKAHDVELIDDR